MTTVIMIVTTFEIIKITITTTMIIFVLMTQPPTVLTPQLVPRGTKLQTPLVPHRWQLKNYFYDFPLKTNKIIFNNIYLNPFQNLQSKSTTPKVRSFVIHLADFVADFLYLFHFDLFLGTRNKCRLNQRISASLTSNLTSTCSGLSEIIG